MDVWGLTVAALRRWYVLLPLLAISLAAAYLVGSRTQADYEVTGAVVLVVPEQAVPNPYAGDFASELLGIRLMSNSTREDFVSQGLPGEYEIDYERRSPVMTMTVVAGSEAVAVETAGEVVAYLDEALDSAQKERDVPRASRVTLEIVDAPDAAEPVVSGRLRVTGVVAVAGTILSLACAVLVDVILVRRRDRARIAASSSPAPEPEPGEAVESAGTEPLPTLSQP